MNLATLEQLQAFTPWTWGKKPAEQGNWGETERWRVAAKCKPLPGLMLGAAPAEHTLAAPEAWAMRNQLHILDLDNCMAEDGQLLEKWQPLYSRLVDYGCPIEKSVSGEGLHAFCRIPDELAPVPQHDRKALYQLKDDLGQLFAAGGRKHRTVIMTMDWQTDSRTIPLLDGEQAAQLLMFAANYERERKPAAKPMPAPARPLSTIGGLLCARGSQRQGEDCTTAHTETRTGRGPDTQAFMGRRQQAPENPRRVLAGCHAGR